MASNSFQLYLQNPRVQKALKSRPGQEGFSLIELVVVIAVLAILSAVALPNFLGVQKDAQVASAKNTLATVVKECVTNGLRGQDTEFADVQAAKGKLNGFVMAAINASSCYSAKATGEGDLPDYSIVYTPNDGVTTKACAVGSTADYMAGCFTSTDLATTMTKAGSGFW